MNTVMKLTKYVLALVVLLFAGGVYGAGDTVLVSQINMPKIPSVSRTAAIYLTIENRGSEAVELIGASTKAAGHTMIHQTVTEAGIAKMRHVDNLLIPAKGILELKSGSYHIMLMGLEKEVINKPFELSLNFAKRESVVVIVSPER